MKLSEERGELVSALQKKPKLDPICEEVGAAFVVLSSRRQWGLSPNPVPLSEILAYIDLFGVPAVGVETFALLIGIMDSKALEIINRDNAVSSGKH
jgi:hypothetical protein